MRRYLLIAIGGAIGAMFRYFVVVVAAERFGTRFPVGTFSINISACFMIGFILEYLPGHANVNPAWRYAFAIGFLGAYSTFSSFEWETWSKLPRGASWIGILYVVASLIVGLVAVSLGSATTQWWRSRMSKLCAIPTRLQHHWSRQAIINRLAIKLSDDECQAARPISTQM